MKTGSQSRDPFFFGFARDSDEIGNLNTKCPSDDSSLLTLLQPLTAYTLLLTMAAREASENAHSTLDDFKPPPGVVLPPREIRNILEKTAGYVARNGAIFEDRIREKNASNPKFSFLNQEDAYNSFYLWRLSEIKDGRGTDVAAGRTGDAENSAVEKPAGPPKPSDFQFSARMPRINQKDLDVLRLTALFVAKNGRPFITQLGQRETGNPQFQFLVPNHTFHNYFQHLVDQYTSLLRASGLEGEGGKLQEERIAELEKNVKDKYYVLDRARGRGEYTRFQEHERRKQEEEEEEKQAEFARVDWGDFVVVETITFNDVDDQANLPPPTNLSELQYASLEERNNASIGASLRIEEAMPGEDLASPGWPGVPRQPPYSLPVHANHTIIQEQQNPSTHDQRVARLRDADSQQPDHRDEVDGRVRQSQPIPGRLTPTPMKIKENYVPRAALKAASRPGAMALCPNCRQQIPMDELEAHMRSESKILRDLKDHLLTDCSRITRSKLEGAEGES